MGELERLIDVATHGGNKHAEFQWLREALRESRSLAGVFETSNDPGTRFRYLFPLPDYIESNSDAFTKNRSNHKIFSVPALSWRSATIVPE